MQISEIIRELDRIEVLIKKPNKTDTEKRDIKETLNRLEKEYV